jgi:hypothetical protein
MPGPPLLELQFMAQHWTGKLQWSIFVYKGGNLSQARGYDPWYPLMRAKVDASSLHRKLWPVKAVAVWQWWPMLPHQQM